MWIFPVLSAFGLHGPNRQRCRARGLQISEPWLALTSKSPLKVHSSQELGPFLQIEPRTTVRCCNGFGLQCAMGYAGLFL